jgi:hypothetical protein
LSGHRVLVAEVKFCKEPSSEYQQLDKVHAGPTAETQVSDRGQRVTERECPWDVTDLDKVSGLVERLQVCWLRVSRAVMLECHKGTLESHTDCVR